MNLSSAAGVLEKLRGEAPDPETAEALDTAMKVMTGGRNSFGLVMNFALRYALGRQSTAPVLVCGYLEPLLPDLDERVLLCIEQDIVDAPFLGDEMVDRPVWIRFLAEVRAELKKRGRKEVYVSLWTGSPEPM